MVEKWDHVPGLWDLWEPLGSLGAPVTPGILGNSGTHETPKDPVGSSGFLRTLSNLWEPVEPLGTPILSLRPPWDQWYSSGCYA